MDAEKGEGIELAERYSVSGYPSWILTNAEGDVLDRWAGYGGPDHFTTALGAGLDDPTTVDQKIARFETDPTLVDAEKVARILSSGGDFNQGIEFYLKADKLDPDSDYAYEIFESSMQACRKDQLEIDVVTASRERGPAQRSGDSREQGHGLLLCTVAGGQEGARRLRSAVPDACL